MYQLLVKTQFEDCIAYQGEGQHITIIELVKKYNKWKTSDHLRLFEVKVLGYLIIDLETDEIVEKFYEPTGESP